MIKELEEAVVFEEFLSPDENDRRIDIYRLKECVLDGANIMYPNCLIRSMGDTFRPMKEQIMSLKDATMNVAPIPYTERQHVRCPDPVFFFIYNTDNYYHFVYDSLPYLISYLHLKKKMSNMKLLMQYPNTNKKSIYPFVLEFLQLLGIDDVVMAERNVIYDEIYISSSYTHGHDSNLPPRNEIFKLYEMLVEKANSNMKASDVYPEKIYVSRRSWMHNDLSNMGTNYTAKRALINESNVVGFLESIGYVEVFTERMSTVEKINMFSKAKSVVGAIGGGICNVLFSNKNTRLTAIISPTFLDVNKRFLHSFSGVITHLFKDTSHYERTAWKKYMRVLTDSGTIGEVSNVMDGKLEIMYLDDNVSGWNSEMEFKTIIVDMKDCRKLDEGLNSSWSMNMSAFKDHMASVTP